MKVKCVILFFLLVSAVVFAEVSAPSIIYSIQMGAYSEQSAAEAKKIEVEAQGFSPVVIIYSSPHYSVQFAEFEYYLDAHIYSTVLSKSIAPDAIVVSKANTGRKSTFPPPAAPLEAIFSPAEANISQAPEYVLNFNDALTAPLLPLLQIGEEEGYVPKDATAAKPLIENLLRALPDSDARKGWAMTRLGVMALENRDYEAARSYFFPVVNGNVAARRLDRIKSMRRVAWTYHIQGNRITAYRAYRELERYTASDLTRAIAGVECAGILMEMARSGKGTLDECRRECQKVLVSAPERFRQQRATAASMYLETYFHEENYQRCTELAQEFLAQYPDIKRDRSSVLLVAAMAYAKTGKYEDAIPLLHELVAMDLSAAQDQFYHHDLQNYAVRWLAWTYDAKGDKENAEYWRVRIRPLP